MARNVGYLCCDNGLVGFGTVLGGFRGTRGGK